MRRTNRQPLGGDRGVRDHEPGAPAVANSTAGRVDHEPPQFAESTALFRAMNQLAVICYSLGMERDTIAELTVAATAILTFAGLVAMIVFNALGRRVPPTPAARTAGAFSLAVSVGDHSELLSRRKP